MDIPVDFDQLQQRKKHFHLLLVGKVTVKGIGISTAQHSPKVLLKSDDDLIHLGLHAFYDDSDKGSQSDVPQAQRPRTVKTLYKGVHEPLVTTLQAYVQIDGANWVPVRGGRIVVYDIDAQTSIQPLNANKFTPGMCLENERL